MTVLLDNFIYIVYIKLCDILHNLSETGDTDTFSLNFKRKIRIILQNLIRFRTLTPSQTKILTEIQKHIEL